MASYDVNKINLSLIKQYKDIFETENTRFNNWSYNTFTTGYLNNCSDPYVRNMASSLKRDYERIKYGYQNISNWWGNYNSGTEDLESKLATSMLESIIDKTINSIDPISLMKYSSFYDGLLDVYNDMFINNIGSKDFSLNKLRALGEENVVVKNFITLYPHIREIDPIEAKNIINLIVSGNVTDEQVVSKVSNVIEKLVETGDIDKINDLTKISQEKDTVIIFDFKELIKKYPQYKDQLETIYKQYNEYQTNKYQEMVNEIALKEDIEAFDGYIYLTRYMSYSYNKVMDYLIEQGKAEKAFKMISELPYDLDKGYVYIDDVLKSFVNNYSTDDMIDLIATLKTNGTVIMIDVKKILEMTKGRDNYDLLKETMNDYYNYQKRYYEEQILNRLYSDSTNFPIFIIETIENLKNRAGIKLDIDYSKEIVNMFLNGMEERAFTFANVLKYNTDKFNSFELIKLLLKDKDENLLVKFLELSKSSKRNILTGAGALEYLKSIKSQDPDFYSRVKDLFNDYFYNYMKENSDPKAYDFLIKTLKESNNPTLNYLYENLYLLCGNSLFFIVTKPPKYDAATQSVKTAFYTPGNNSITITDEVIVRENTRTLIHELGHCLFYVIAENDFPKDYIDDPRRYTDRLLIDEEGTYMLNDDATNYMNHLYELNSIMENEFRLQFDDNKVRDDIIKEVSEDVNSTDISELEALLDEAAGVNKIEFIMSIKGTDEETLNAMSDKEIDLLLAGISKEEIINFIVNSEFKSVKSNASFDFNIKSYEGIISRSASDIIASVLKGKTYSDRKTGKKIDYCGAHSESYYNNSLDASFNEQVAEYFVLKIVRADDEIERLRKLLGDDWYNMMEDAYNKSVSKLGGDKGWNITKQPMN